MRGGEIDDWESCDWTRDHIDGIKIIGDKPDSEGARVIGRFWFDMRVIAGYGYNHMYPFYTPNGEDLIPGWENISVELFLYWGENLFPLTIQYNAGLLNLVNRRVTVKTNQFRANNFEFSRNDNFGKNRDFSTRDGETFYFVAKERLTLKAPDTNDGNLKFLYWLRDDGTIYNNNPITFNYDNETCIPKGSGAIYTAVYEGPSGTVEVKVNPSHAQWKIDGPENFEGNDVIFTGDQTFYDAPQGYYYWYAESLGGYSSPSYEKKWLEGNDDTITFNKSWNRIEGGTITVNVTPDNAVWKLDGPSGFTGNNERYVGDQIFDYAPAGEYTWTGELLSSYITPENQTKNLSDGGEISFNRTWTMPQTITVNVAPPHAQWTISGPQGFEGNNNNYAGNKIFNNVPEGDYTWTGKPLDGYITPDTTTQKIETGKSILFDKTWVQASKSIHVNVTPANACWTISGPPDFEGNGSEYCGNGLFPNVPYGSYTCTPVTLDGYISPSPQTKSLQPPQETLSFNLVWIQQLPAALAVTPDTQEVAAEAGKTTFAVSNTGEGVMGWSARVILGSSWLKIEPGSTSGTNQGTINVSYEENTTTVSRKGKIEVTAPGANPSVKQVSVVQNRPDHLVIEPSSRNHSSGSSFNQLIWIYSNVSWTAKSNNPWISIIWGHSGSNNGSFYYNIDKNNRDARSGTITISSADGKLTTLFTVNQSAAEAWADVIAPAPQNDCMNENIEIPYILYDSQSRPTNIYAQYSLDSGASWNWAWTTSPVDECMKNLASSPNGVQHFFPWYSARQAPCDAFENILFRIMPFNAGGDGSWATSPQTFCVDNLFQIPWLTNYGATRTKRCHIPIYYGLVDCTGEPTNIHCKYSIDGGNTWDWAYQAPGGDGQTNLSTSGEGIIHTFMWDAARNLTWSRYPDVRFAILPYNTKGMGGFWKSQPFEVTNSKLPYVLLYTPESPAVGGTIRVYMKVVDYKSYKTNITAWFSSNGGNNWHPASSANGTNILPQLTTTPEGVLYFFPWKAGNNLGMGTFNNIKFAVRADNIHGHGDWEETGVFTVRTAP